MSVIVAGKKHQSRPTVFDFRAIAASLCHHVVPWLIAAAIPCAAIPLAAGLALVASPAEAAPASPASQSVTTPRTSTSAANASVDQTIGESSLSFEDLRAPDRAVQFVVGQEKGDYERILNRYRGALGTHTNDAALALSQCKFISSFAWSEDVPWSDAAANDLQDCSNSLEKRFSDNPDVRLFMLDRRYSAEAIAYGTPLVERSKDWTNTQRAHLHASLSRAYSVTKDTSRSGQEALLTVQLDPGNERLNDAIRYLVGAGKTQDAVALLAAAPVPKLQWQETMRIDTAASLLPAASARAELERAQKAGFKIDAYTTARVLFSAGDVAGAQKALTADTSSRKFESPQNKQLRLDVAFASHDGKAAAAVLADQYQKTQNAYPLTFAYAHVLALSPSAAGQAGVSSVGWVLFGELLAFVAAPGLILFPAHYRGTVRQRVGKVSMPLFGRVGLRHAWYALTVFFFALYFVAMFRQGTATLSTSGSGVTHVEPPGTFAVTHLWTLAIAATGLLFVACTLTWREWIGTGRWKAKWVLVALLPYIVVLLSYLANRHALIEATKSNYWAVNLIHGAVAIGGLPLAFALLSVFVPLVEEFVFRCSLLGGLTRHISFGWANVLQAALFALMHNDSKHYFQLLVMGLTAGWLAKKSQGLAMPVVLHAVNNAIFVYLVAVAGA